MKKALFLICIVLLHVNEVLAAPGGKIIKEMFDTPLGKVVMVLLTIILLPLIIAYWYKRNKAIRETRKRLSQLAQINHELFDEINLKNRMTDIFMRVHKAWSERDLDDVEAYMTSWYRQNQQTVYLDEWDSKGLMNVCTIQDLNSIKPIHVRITNDPNFEGSRIMYAIESKMEDYLVSIEDSSVIEGKKGFRDVEQVWTLKLIDQIWKVDNIELSEMISQYSKMSYETTDPIIERLAKQSSHI